MRDGLPADSPDLLLSALDGAAMPSVDGRAYLLAESQVVRALGGRLEQRGLVRDRIFAKGYSRAAATTRREQSA
jgi:hypothetical protein